MCYRRPEVAAWGTPDVMLAGREVLARLAPSTPALRNPEGDQFLTDPADLTALEARRLIERRAFTRGVRRTDGQWFLTSLQPKLIKIGARVVRHARAITFQLAEVAVSGPTVHAIFTANRRLRAPPSCA